MTALSAFWLDDPSLVRTQHRALVLEEKDIDAVYPTARDRGSMLHVVQAALSKAREAVWFLRRAYPARLGDGDWVDGKGTPLHFAPKRGPLDVGKVYVVAVDDPDPYLPRPPAGWRRYSASLQEQRRNAARAREQILSLVDMREVATRRLDATETFCMAPASTDGPYLLTLCPADKATHLVSGPLGSWELFRKDMTQLPAEDSYGRHFPASWIEAILHDDLAALPEVADYHFAYWLSMGEHMRHLMLGEYCTDPELDELDPSFPLLDPRSEIELMLPGLLRNWDWHYAPPTVPE